jgi:phosphatidylserine/phosphatidylglycerophosphate/cardiolipin synthase-like enzyme
MWLCTAPARRRTAPPVRNHAKFIVVDHCLIIVTSANFSSRAEKANVELGVRVDDPELCRAVERQYARLEESVFERVEG